MESLNTSEGATVENAGMIQWANYNTFPDIFVKMAMDIYIQPSLKAIYFDKNIYQAKEVCTISVHPIR